MGSLRVGRDEVDDGGVPRPAATRLTNGVSHPHPVKGGRWYRPARRPPRSSRKPGWERSATTASVAVRHEPQLSSGRPAVRTAAMTASTVTAANTRPWSSTRPTTGDAAAICTVALKRVAPRTVRLVVDGWTRDPQ